MKTYRRVIEIITDKKEGVIDITERVMEILKESGIKEGFCLVFSLHTSSGVYISDSDYNLTYDLLNILNDLLPRNKEYLHNKVDYKKNATAHLKTILTSHHVLLPITNGNLDLGLYHTIYYAEFDGRRKKEILVKIIGE